MIFRLPQDDKPLSCKPFFVKLADISERTAVRYILSSHTQKAVMTFNTNPHRTLKCTPKVLCLTFGVQFSEKVPLFYGTLDMEMCPVGFSM